MLTSKLTWIDGQAFASHEQMECVQRGMYKPLVDDGAVFEAAVVLQNLNTFAPIALEACPISTAVHLTNNAVNQKAFVGQISCCVAVGATIVTTTKAWWSLAECQRDDANEQAKEVIEQWKSQNLRNADYHQRSVQLEFPF